MMMMKTSMTMLSSPLSRRRRNNKKNITVRILISIGMMMMTMFITMFIATTTTNISVVYAAAQQSENSCPKEPMDDGIVDCSVSSFGGKCAYPDKRDSTNCVWTCRCDGSIFHCSYREHPGSPMTGDHKEHNNICSTIPVDTPERQCNHL
jgi:hypothetical protein